MTLGNTRHLGVQRLVATCLKMRAARRVGQTEDGGMPSYVEMVECLLATIRVK